MPIQLTHEDLRKIWPKAPETVISVFVAKQHLLDKAGITHTRTRLSIACSQVEHECGGYALPKLTENINYSAERAAEIWPGRFPGGAAQVRAKYGTDKGWQLKMFDDVYGNRMGNRPGTSDGSKFIGRGGPQITGRDGYRETGRRAGVPLEDRPDLAGAYEYQPEILCAFWVWKNLNPVADAGGLRAVTKPWNGGFIGMADREAKMRGNDPVIERMKIVERVIPVAKEMPGNPPTPTPPKEVLDATTVNERRTQKAGVGTAAGGTIAEGSSMAAKEPLITPWVTYTCIGVGVALIVITAVMVARKHAAVVRNWF
jgi:predicted chitinase